MTKPPVSIVKDKFGDKAKLVAALEPFTKDEGLWVGRLNDKKGLARVSNAKLIRLHRIFSDVKTKFGTRAKLIDAICAASKREKDAGFRKRLEAYPVPRLYDLYRASAVSEKSNGATAKAKSAKPASGAKAAPAAKATATKSTAAPKKEKAADAPKKAPAKAKAAPKA